jgi:hypothetical protein
LWNFHTSILHDKRKGSSIFAPSRNVNELEVRNSTVTNIEAILVSILREHNLK